MEEEWKIDECWFEASGLTIGLTTGTNLVKSSETTILKDVVD